MRIDDAGEKKLVVAKTACRPARSRAGCPAAGQTISAVSAVLASAVGEFGAVTLKAYDNRLYQPVFLVIVRAPRVSAEGAPLGRTPAPIPRSRRACHRLAARAARTFLVVGGPGLAAGSQRPDRAGDAVPGFPRLAGAVGVGVKNYLAGR